MLQLIARRLLVMVPVLVLVSVLAFALVLLVPGDPAITLAGDNPTDAQVEATRDRLGLDDPITVRYWRWASDAGTGDLGSSLFSSQQVTGAVFQRMPITLSLTGGAIVVAIVLGGFAGTLSAMYRGRWVDRLLSVGAASGLAMPNYFIGMLLIVYFAIWNSWLPSTGYVPLSDGVGGWAKHLILPWITLGVAAAAVVARQLRSSLIGVLNQDYVRTARAKGLRGWSVIVKHSIKNAAIPVATVLGTQVAYLLGGSVIVERVFGMAGIGDLAVTAVFRRDLPMIQGVVMLTAVIVLLANLVVDVAYGYFNPKVRVQ